LLKPLNNLNARPSPADYFNNRKEVV